MPGPQGLLNEIHRRSLWQILGLYIAGSWVVLQVVATFVEQLFLPSWVFRGALVLLAVGLPVLLATAAVQKGLRSPPNEEQTALRRLLTWKRSLLAGVVAFAVLACGAGAWMAMRSLGVAGAGTLVSKGVLKEQATIVLADFASPDSMLAHTATEALRVDLSQSRTVRLAPDRFLSGAMQRMRREPGPLDAETARELAVREGLSAVVSGEINAIGEGFVLTAQVEAPESGEVLVSRRETADNAGEIIQALERLSLGLRERIGESLAGLRATPPLERVTTGSLDAFNKYSQARVAALSGDPNRAAGLLREAVAIDADFAMAWRMLAAVLNDTGSRGQAERNEALTRAFELGDRLTDRERYLIEGDYYRSVVDDPAAAARAYDNLLDLYPSDFGGLVNRSVVAEDTRDWALGVELMERALALDSTIVNFYARLAHLHVNRGELEAADALMERMGRNLPGHPAILDLTADIAVARGDLRAAVQPVDDLAASYPGPRFVLKRMALAGAVGRLDDAERDRRTLEDMFAGAGAPSEALRVSLGRALQEAIVRGNPAGAARVIDEALDRYPLDQMAPMDRPYVTAGGPPLVQALALAGETERARALLEEYRRVAPEDQYEEIDARRGMRHVLISEGRYDEALEDLRGPTDNCVYCDLVEYARAYEGAGPPDSAAAAWARLADVPWWAKLNWDQFWLGPALERAAQLYDQLGDLERAAEYYARLVEVWAEADPDLQPRVLAAQARLQQLFEEIG